MGLYVLTYLATANTYASLVPGPFYARTARFHLARNARV